MAFLSNAFADTPPPTPTMAPPSQPRIYYFISRSNGRFVPLIPADELPYSVRLAGIPRVITLEQTCGMQHVGMLPYTSQFFKLEDNSMVRTTSQLSNTPTHARTVSDTSTPTQFLAPDALVRPATSQGSTSTPTILPTRPVSAAATAKNWRNPNPDPITAPADPTQAFIDAIVAANAESAAQTGYPTPKSTPPLPSDPNGKKQYCTYWIRHGECDYIQQGCRYLHEMPDRATLETIGFRTVPRWWQEKTAPNLGGSRVPTLEGRVVKSEEWLKRRDSAVSDADDESEVDSDDASSSARSSRKASLSTDEEAKHPKDLTARKQTPPPIVIRKPSSTPSVDLLTFAPLIPTPSSSTNSDTSLTPLSGSPAHPTHPQPSRPAQTATTLSPRKIFVPAGESPTFHISQARKNAIPQRAQPIHPTTPDKIPPQSHHRARAAPQGLLASRHAPPTTTTTTLPTATPSRQSRKPSLTTSSLRSTSRPRINRGVECADTNRASERRVSVGQTKRFPRVEGRVRRAVGFSVAGKKSGNETKGAREEGSNGGAAAGPGLGKRVGE